MVHRHDNIPAERLAAEAEAATAISCASAEGLASTALPWTSTSLSRPDRPDGGGESEYCRRT